MNYFWLGPQTAAVSQLQSITTPSQSDGQYYMLLNGTEGTQYGLIPVKLQKISTNITLTGTTSSNTQNFTITGSLAGQSITETIAGPGLNSTVTTASFFDTIISITSSNAITQVSAGISGTGWTDWFNFNTFCSYPALSIQVVPSQGSTIDYTFQVTLDYVWSLLEADITTFNPILTMTNTTTKQLANINYPIQAARIYFNSSTSAASVVMIQQGIN